MRATYPSPPLSTLETRILRSANELVPLSEQWYDLWFRSGQSPFQSPMWLLPWIEHFTGDNLVVVAIHAESKLVAIAPFYLWSEGRERKMLLAGNGVSDYLDLCVDPVYRTQAIAAIEECLEYHEGWNNCEFNQLPANSILLQSKQCLAEPGVPCLLLDLQNKSRDGFAPLRQIEKLRYYRRRAAKLGHCEITRATFANTIPLMHELFRLHALRWRNRGEAGVLDRDLVQQFHLAVADKMANSGHLRLYALTLNGQTVGVLYAFVDSRSTYYYLSGFDPEFEKISPGTLLIGHAIEEAIIEQHREFNFLRGSEPYKYSWGAAEQETFRAAINRCAPPSS